MHLKLYMPIRIVVFHIFCGSTQCVNAVCVFNRQLPVDLYFFICLWVFSPFSCFRKPSPSLFAPRRTSLIVNVTTRACPSGSAISTTAGHHLLLTPSSVWRQTSTHQPSITWRWRQRSCRGRVWYSDSYGMWCVRLSHPIDRTSGRPLSQHGPSQIWTWVHILKPNQPL